MTKFLMGLPRPGAATVESVGSAVAWIRKVALKDVVWTRGVKTGDGLERSPGAPRLWARMYEIGTDKPVFGDRDRTIHYVVTEISIERQRGYRWYGNWPETLLGRYDAWCAKLKKEPTKPKATP